MPVEIRCPHCGTLSHKPDEVIGRWVECGDCRRPFTADHATTLQTATTAIPTGPLAPGDRVGRYHVVRLLGAGGMGAVYLADDTELNRRVALKVPTLAADGAERDGLFRQEARAAAALDHPHICHVFDFGTDGGRLFLAMKYVPGRPLNADAGPWDRTAAAGLVRTLARALQHAHDRGVVHRDLKPANVLRTETGEPVVTDFGLALLIADDARRSDGRVCGTAAYMAPEQARGDADIGPPADVYALGVMLFELLAGRPPFAGSVRAILDLKLADPCPRLRTVIPDADPRLDAVCGRAMAAAPADRFPSMAAFAAALDDVLSGDLVVDANGFGGYATVSAAVVAAVPGSVIRIRPGRYPELVTLAVGLTLVGDGDRGAVVLDGVIVTAGSPTLRNLTVRRLRVSAGGPELTDCGVTDGMVVENTRTNPTLTACEIRGGVGVLERATGTFARCRVTGSVVLEDDANPTFLDCQVTASGDAGLVVRRGGRGTFDRCLFAGHKSAGVYVYDHGNPTLTDCEVRDNRGPGVTVVRHGQGRFDRCRVVGNARAGVLVEDDGDPTVVDCAIRDGPGDGVFVQAGGRGRFERCEVAGHKRSGVAVQDDGEPTVVDSVVRGNGYQGVSVYVGGRGTFVGNDLRGNARGPWEVNPEAVVARRGNRE